MVLSQAHFLACPVLYGGHWPDARMKTHTRSFGLDLVRTVAISLVLVSHFAKKIEILGFWGVELFFGLSGFLIGQILWRNFQQAKDWGFKHIGNFWQRRWWRTLPNYYLFLLLMLLFHLFIVKSGIPSVVGLLQFLWFGQDLFNLGNIFYAVSWSLCIEEWFYLLFPIVLFLFASARLKPRVAFSCTLATFFIACFLQRQLLSVNGHNYAIRELTFCRLDAIACGVMTAFVTVEARPGRLMKWLAFLIGCLLLFFPLGAIYFFGANIEGLTGSPYLLLIIPLGASLTLPLVAMLEVDAKTRLAAAIARWVENISHWSYSIYLCHIPILFTVYKLMDGVRGNAAGNLLSKLVGFLATVFVSGLLFRFFESYFTAKRPKEIN